MTIDDLTAEQRRQLQRTCIMDWREMEKALSESGEGSPSRHVIWNLAFSRGLMAGLGVPERSTVPIVKGEPIYFALEQDKDDPDKEARILKLREDLRSGRVKATDVLDRVRSNFPSATPATYPLPGDQNQYIQATEKKPDHA